MVADFLGLVVCQAVDCIETVNVGFTCEIRSGLQFCHDDSVISAVGFGKLCCLLNQVLPRCICVPVILYSFAYGLFPAAKSLKLFHDFLFLRCQVCDVVIVFIVIVFLKHSIILGFFISAWIFWE